MIVTTSTSERQAQQLPSDQMDLTINDLGNSQSWPLFPVRLVDFRGGNPIE